MYFNNAGWLLSALYPSLIWKKKPEEKIIYLTFDDGPIPDVTEYVLSELKKYSIKATFFCVGDNIRKHPEVFQKILREEHRIGNHTFNHLKGWKTDDDKYFENVQKCEEIIRSSLVSSSSYLYENHSKLFRPPYGLIKKSQIKELNKEYEIVMWDVLTGDFDQKLSKKDCLNKALKFTRNGSIVIFHDSFKAKKNLSYVLPKYIEHYLALGYRFEKL
jgi:peptidoglycan/xylan/chitin deacetylase (PgdA/CDA1 family)